MVVLFAPGQKPKKLLGSGRDSKLEVFIKYDCVRLLGPLLKQAL